MCEINITSFSMELNSLLPKNFRNDIQNIEPDIMVLLDECFELLHEKSGSGEAINVSQIVIDITWEQLNTGHWSEVEDSERQIYALASLLKVVAMVQNVKQEPQEKIREILEAALKVVDMGLLLGSSYATELNHIANLLNSALYTDEGKDFESSRPTSDVLIKVDTEPLKSLLCPSLETFSAEHFYPRQPVKLIGCISHWKALTCWKDVNYLLRVAGGRTVPIELGSKYTDSDWSQKLMTLRTFISKYVVNGASSENAYLAQHQLFNQIPELKQDIVVPDYCCCSDNQGAELDNKDVDINAWFGPGGTVSPLHYDPKHNLLSQVVGSKRIILYPPKLSESLYPHGGKFLNNTSQVDPENPDYKMFPKYRDTMGLQCTLNPGEMLYIPPAWWHHVRALDVSFSVSFWWE